MTRRLICLILCLLLCPVIAGAESPNPVMAEAGSIGKVVHTYDSETLKYTIERFGLTRELCYLTRVWVEEPARQIRKITSNWKKDLKAPHVLARSLKGSALAVNGSGYVSPRFPEIPDDYPGESADYYFTPLGSLTVTDGQLLRNLEDVTYNGLTLDEDGIHMVIDADNETVLASQPVQTWAFYPQCTVMLDNVELLPEEWNFAEMRAARNLIARIDKHTYVFLTASSKRAGGISLYTAAAFFRDHFQAEWVYNLDGGTSTALVYRLKDKKNYHYQVEGGAKVVDIMAFTE